MKYVIEFGQRKGLHVDNMIVPTKALAERLVHNLQMVFSQEHPQKDTWKFGPKDFRKMWFSDTHFIALSKLDGLDRGPASASLWRT